MSEPIYKPKTVGDVQRRKEWVSLDGGRLCVWEMTVQEGMAVMQRAERPAIDKRGGMDRSESVLWQIMMSCYDGDQPGAKLIFDPLDPGPVFRMRMEEFEALSSALARVNGLDKEEVKSLDSFFDPTREPIPSMSRSGA